MADCRVLRQFAQTPAVRFADEHSHLQPLPPTDFDTSYFDIRHVAWDEYIEVRGNRYSVPEAWCEQAVSIRITPDNELRIYADEQLVASHRLSTEVPVLANHSGAPCPTLATGQQGRTSSAKLL
ncbi:protein of unknown function [Xenorhabdus nematophila AN6/1]|nr:hypothetical protein XNA1_1310009 [Xenorhabdus nematophila str. Anatoliense]CEE95110.1 hypothetical protein XNA1_4960009 [Xenorhabdus nematophila str. Anatoliense]CEK23687.1 protein of unknown function [Xenorhabdus nematophila AN6/1]